MKPIELKFSVFIKIVIIDNYTIIHSLINSYTLAIDRWMNKIKEFWIRYDPYIIYLLLFMCNSENILL